MPNDRFFYDFPLTLNQEIQLETTEFHHLKNVARSKQGDAVDLVNGQGQLASAILKKIGKNTALLQVNHIDQSPEPIHSVILAQAIPRIHRLDFILEKGTELGLTEFWLFPGDQSERKKLTEHQIQRLRAITIAAMKQCGRLYLPTISIKPRLCEWPPQQIPAFFGDLSPNAPPLFHAWQQNRLHNEVLFFIGPESGFTDEEETALRNFGAKGVKLHQNILRTDTAALAALTLASQMMMINPREEHAP